MTVGFSGIFLSTSSLKKVSRHKLHSKAIYLTCTTKRISLDVAASLNRQWRITPRVTLLRTLHSFFKFVPAVLPSFPGDWTAAIFELIK